MSILQRPGWVNQISLNEARSSRHAGLLDLSIVQKQLADKKIGIPYRDARRFLFSFLQEYGVVEGDVPQTAKDINAIVGELATSGKITPELSNAWKDYVDDISNLQRFIGSTRTMRGRLTDNPEEGNRPATREEIMQRAEQRRFERKLASPSTQISDIEDFDEYKLIKIGVLKHMFHEIEKNEELFEDPGYVKAIDYITNVIEKSDSIETLTTKLDNIIDETDNNQLLAITHLALQSLSAVIPSYNGGTETSMQESTKTQPVVNNNIKLSPQAQDRLLKESRRKNLQHKMAIEQKYFGY